VAVQQCILRDYRLCLLNSVYDDIVDAVAQSGGHSHIILVIDLSQIAQAAVDSCVFFKTAVDSGTLQF
jgi:hypothetical protein